METTFDMSRFLTSLLQQLPYLVPMLAGLAAAFALVLRRRATLGAAAAPALGGLTVLLAALLLSTAWYALAEFLLVSGAVDFVTSGYAFAIVSLVLATLNAAGIVLLALAIVRRPG
ncbi:hypothetical protein LDO26_17780 [Luteimonas sp. BDR2-5]|uniref:hypothetical protein n=1 Tax=Proluteimonas luteida TaxID=2878685 RepID=UPI001E2C003F|nr:hypothetical protein [Luteimonas sp. BDR2-5]MCD9030042.1 hypothetical protein [Luteimonas sp. BDR2-5]